jgi:5-oxoprolinase (ATP-hydrolysing)
LLYQRVLQVDERVALNQYFSNESNDDNDDSNNTIVKGLTGEDVRILKTPNLDNVRHDLQKLRDEGIQALAICCMHSYTFPHHELMIGQIAQEIGFEQISLSSQVMPMVKLVSR